MTSEQKQLLLKELCTRMLYGVICTDLRHSDSKITEVDIEDGLVYCFDFDEWVKVENCRLYLRPMSSMTENERKEFLELSDCMIDDWVIKPETCCYFMNKLSDWLNEHHFDYRGLIEKGLAIEAPEGMYDKID